jgi:nuclease-like protein
MIGTTAGLPPGGREGGVRPSIEAAPLGSGRQDGLGSFPQEGRYKRILGQVLVNRVDAGLDQIETGMAWHYKRYEREQSTEDRVA